MGRLVIPPRTDSWSRTRSLGVSSAIAPVPVTSLPRTGAIVASTEGRCPPRGLLPQSPPLENDLDQHDDQDEAEHPQGDRRSTAPPGGRRPSCGPRPFLKERPGGTQARPNMIWIDRGA